MVTSRASLGRLWNYFDRGGLLLALQSISYRLTGRDLITPPIVPLYRYYKEKTESTVTYLGVDFDPSHDIITDDVLAQFLTSYEFAEATLLDTYLDTDHDIVELGGGIGFVSCYVSSKLNPDQKHVVAEPNPKLVPLIEDTQRRNGCGFELLQTAYSPHSEAVSFSRNEDFLSSSTVTRTDTSTTEKLEVSGVSLADLTADFGIDEFVLIADIEGAEYELLRQERHLLGERCSLAFVEIHEIDGESLSDIIDLFRDAGFVQRDREGDVWLFENTTTD